MDGPAASLTSRPLDEGTRVRLARLLALLREPCVLGLPDLGAAVVRRGVRLTWLGVDEATAGGASGWLDWDPANPTPIPRRFDVIAFDGPHETLGVKGLARAVRVLARHDSWHPLLAVWPARRVRELQRAFVGFELQPTGWAVRREGDDEPATVLANLPEEDLALLGPGPVPRRPGGHGGPGDSGPDGGMGGPERGGPGGDPGEDPRDLR